EFFTDVRDAHKLVIARASRRRGTAEVTQQRISQPRPEPGHQRQGEHVLKMRGDVGHEKITPPLLWSGLLTRPPGPPEGLPEFLETFGQHGGTVGRPCHNASWRRDTLYS